MFDGAAAATTTAVAANQPVIRKQKHIWIVKNHNNFKNIFGSSKIIIILKTSFDRQK
jgi:hypothetical protein